ncbi:hypothetical protein [Aquitalea sp.]|jgi:hypothetical protein|uniref:hypothetical protein n=1 Tax=Aquitalea sp. TaxID=1872623 RepID=UPI0025860CB4|nr:hypothetical protein [Aquitalea sp.]
MNTAHQELSAQSQPILRLGIKLMALSLDCAEKIVHFNLALGQAGLDTCALSVKELMAATTPGDAISKINHIASHASSKLMHCSNELCNDLSKNHENLRSLTEQHFGILHTALSDQTVTEESKRKAAGTTP